MRHFFKTKLMAIFCLAFIHGCHSTDAENPPQDNKKSSEESKTEETKTEQTKTEQTQSDESKEQPQVSTTPGGRSKPLSESAGNAESNKHPELYIVPNRDPRKKINNPEETEEKKEPPK